jgi:hypothetical protein
LGLPQIGVDAVLADFYLLTASEANAKDKITISNISIAVLFRFLKTTFLNIQSIKKLNRKNIAPINRVNANRENQNSKKCSWTCLSQSSFAPIQKWAEKYNDAIMPIRMTVFNK